VLNARHLLQRSRNFRSLIQADERHKAPSSTCILRYGLVILRHCIAQCSAMASKVPDLVAYCSTEHLPTMPTPTSSSTLTSTSNPLSRSITSSNSKPSRKLAMLVARGPDDGEVPTHGNYDGVRVCDNEDSAGAISSTAAAGQAVAPFLAKHIPQQYAPLGLPERTLDRRDPNTKFCYRHRPDQKCRRTADEPLMESLQRVCQFLAALIVTDRF
jgi:hypothetical protein